MNRSEKGEEDDNDQAEMFSSTEDNNPEKVHARATAKQAKSSSLVSLEETAKLLSNKCQEYEEELCEKNTLIDELTEGYDFISLRAKIVSTHRGRLNCVSHLSSREF
jgi:hypothetical protein